MVSKIFLIDFVEFILYCVLLLIVIHKHSCLPPLHNRIELYKHNRHWVYCTICNIQGFQYSQISGIRLYQNIHYFVGVLVNPSGAHLDYHRWPVPSKSVPASCTLCCYSQHRFLWTLKGPSFLVHKKRSS